MRGMQGDVALASGECAYSWATRVVGGGCGDARSILRCRATVMHAPVAAIEQRDNCPTLTFEDTFPQSRGTSKANGLFLKRRTSA